MKNLFKYIFVAAAMVISSAAASAQTGDPNAIKVDKRADGPNADGSYTLTLDTYVSGESDTRQQTTVPTPADIVLVLDVSGSMNEPISGTPSKTKDTAVQIYNSWLDNSKYYYIKAGSSTPYYRIEEVTVSGSNYSAKYYTGSYSNGSLFATMNLSNTNIKNYVYEGTMPRIEALKQATKDFIDIIAANTKSNVQNRISIVKFAGQGSGNNHKTLSTDAIGNGFTDGRNNTQKVTEHLLATDSRLKDAVDELIATGATATYGGFVHANAILDAVTRPSKKSVIHFTDGATNSSVSDVVKITNDLKQGTDAKNASTSTGGAATIYSIGTGSAVTDFLSFTSSNYSFDVKYNNSKYSGTEIPPKDKFYSASDVSSLREAFKQVAGSTTPETTGGQGIDLTTESVTIKDIVSTHFVIPEGANSVKLSVIPVLVESFEKPYASADTYVPKWDFDHADNNPEGVSYAIVETTDSKGNATKGVDVTGFDFSSNWVGLERSYMDDKETDRRVHAEGKMLRITITIFPDPNDVGGEVRTNDDKSGFYYDGKVEPLQPYITPGPVFVPMDMDIILNGLDADESALFKVYRYEKDDDGNDTDKKKYIMTVALTGASSATTVSKLPIVDYIEDKDDPALIHESPIKYVVECDSNWSWKYTITPSETELEDDEHALFYRTDGGKFMDSNTFVFNAVKTEKGRLPVGKNDNGGTAKYVYDESNVNNVFNRVTK